MLFTANANDLHQGMNLVTRAIQPRTAKLAYEGVFMETVEEGLQLTCTNGEMTIKTISPAACQTAGGAVK